MLRQLREGLFEKIVSFCGENPLSGQGVRFGVCVVIFSCPPFWTFPPWAEIFSHRKKADNDFCGQRWHVITRRNPNDKHYLLRCFSLLRFFLLKYAITSSLLMPASDKILNKVFTLNVALAWKKTVNSSLVSGLYRASWDPLLSWENVQPKCLRTFTKSWYVKEFRKGIIM